MKTQLDPCCCGLWHDEQDGKKIAVHHSPGLSAPIGSGFCEHCRCERCQRIRQRGFVHSKVPAWREG